MLGSLFKCIPNTVAIGIPAYKAFFIEDVSRLFQGQSNSYILGNAGVCFSLAFIKNYKNC
jgi:hypothetical protein